MAEMMIDELHPIKNTPIEIAFPVLFGPWGFLKRCIYGDVVEQEVFADEFKVNMMQKSFGNLTSLTPEARKILRLQETKKQRDIQRKKDLKNKDPYLSLGYGLIAYRRTLFDLSMGFIMMSILMYPVIKTFQKGTALTPEDITKYGMYSIANLGYATVQCGASPFNMEHLVLSCPFGNIT
jgi:hypothetical protein